MALKPSKTGSRKGEAARRANQVIRGRTILLMALLGIGTFALLFGRLYDLQNGRHAEMLARAVKQQTLQTPVAASRGTIYDKNHNVLAISATAETVCVDPLLISRFVASQEEAQKTAAEKAAKEGKSYTPAEILDQAYIARGLGRILEMEPERIEKMIAHTDWQYSVVRSKVEREMADEVRRFINGEIDDEGNEITGDWRPITGVFLELGSKRYYPYNTMAANVLGFVNSENKGGVGLEAKYEGDLSGISGMKVSAKINRGETPLLFQYEQIFDAENGNDLVLTLDINVQMALEKGIESMLSKFSAANGGTGIVMDVNSGAILGMASYPNYDANQSGVLYDPKLEEKMNHELAELEKTRSSYETEETYNEAVSKVKTNAIQTQWRNKCIDSTYEPGSTFKPITLATALEEGLIDMNSTFQCSGSVMVKGWNKPINCSKKSGHGLQILKVAVGNSCNPAFINIGLKIGTETYYKYLKSFGLMEKTNVDMIGEVQGIFATEKNFNSNIVSLASYSFGQTFNVTPLALIRAQAACVNGGYLYEPYIVDQVLDGEGNVLEQREPKCIRQVISEETSAKVRECLEYVVAEGSGKNGQVAGYRIGGKTGTADKTGTATAENPKGDIVVSFMCFAPADDPQYIMLITMDTPSRTTGTYPSGGQMVSPVASQIMSEILPILGLEPDYTAEEMVGADAAVPYVVDMTALDAGTRLENAGFAFRTIGSGSVVTDQTPAGGAIVPNNATVILYMGEEKTDALCKVPNVVGKTAAEANRALTDAGLIMRVAGTTSTNSGNVHAISQDRPEGAELEAGSVVTVRFGDSSVLD